MCICQQWFCTADMTFVLRVKVKILKICLHGLKHLHFRKCKWFIFGTLVVYGLFDDKKGFGLPA